MSYMGPRFVGGGGQIFPQGGGASQSFQSQQQMRQYQMVQMQLQLQQKIQMQKQQMNAKAAGQDNSAANNNMSKKPILAPTTQNQTPNQGINRANQNQPMNRTNQNQGPNRPNQNQSRPQNSGPSGPSPKPAANQTQPSNQRNVSASPQQNQKDKLPENAPPLPPPTKPTPNAGSNDNRNQSGVTAQGKDKPDASNKGVPKKPRFGNRPNSPPQSQHQQGSQAQFKVPLMNTMPGQGGLQVKQEIKAEHTSPNKGRANQNYMDNRNMDNRNNAYEEQDKHNQTQGSNRNFGRAAQNFSNQRNTGQSNQNQGHQQYQENFHRQGRATANSSEEYQSHPRRGGGNASQSSNYKGGRNYFGQDKVKEKALQAFTAPMTELEPLDISEKKFNAYARLFIGNIPKNCEQKEVVSLFEKYGEIGSVYLNKDSSFAFINLDFKANAAKAMRELDNTSLKNRFLKVRYATINEGIRVRNLSPYVSNELLEKAFSIFGMSKIESCRVVVDDRGNPKREGVIIFRDKKVALLAVKKCQEECFFLSGALRPVVVTSLEPSEDNADGFYESMVPKNDEFHTERQIPPHFADNGSFEFEFGVQWKQLYNMYDEKKAILDRDFQIELERLEKKMVLAKVEYEAEKLRKELAQREAESAQLRRHFEFATDQMGGGASSLGQSSGSGGPSNDYYSGGGKRPLEQGYDTAYGGPYDTQYNDNYDRGGYAQGNYERGYGGGYGRDEYLREGGGYPTEDSYERPPYDRPVEGTQERKFDAPVDQGYTSSTPAEQSLVDPYKAPNKRPRY